MRFYADENFPLAVVVELRRLGHDVITAFEDGRANKAVSDEKVLARSAKLDRILLTINRRDFIRLHNAGREHSGMILCTFDADFEGQARRIHAECEGFDNLKQKAVRVNRPS